MFDEVEALDWLNNNANPCAFAHFRDTGAAAAFVQRLYALGALEVRVTGILDEAWRIEQEGGPVADTLVVQLPGDEIQRQCLLDLYALEVKRNGCNRGQQPGLRGDILALWWWD